MAFPLTTPPLRVEVKRDDSSSQTNCDGQNILFCPAGTCYTGSEGFVGCCTVQNCVARTTCIDYDANAAVSCDSDYGGCLSCSNPNNPGCVTLRNMQASQYAFYCGATAQMIATEYPNLVLTGSMAASPIGSSAIPVSTATAVLTGQQCSNSCTSEPSTSSAAAAGSTPGPSSAISAAGVPATSSDPQTTTSALTSTTPAPTHLSGGAIGGIAIGALAGGAALIALIAFFILRRVRRAASNVSHTNSQRDTMPMYGHADEPSSASYKVQPLSAGEKTTDGPSELQAGHRQSADPREMDGTPSSADTFGADAACGGGASVGAYARGAAASTGPQYRAYRPVSEVSGAPALSPNSASWSSNGMASAPVSPALSSPGDSTVTAQGAGEGGCRVASGVGWASGAYLSVEEAMADPRRI